jgi:hypothetical protein
LRPIERSPMPRKADVARIRVSEQDRFIRCLKIVEHTYWSDSASVRELAKSVGRLPIATSGTVPAVRRDVARLQSQGLPIAVEPVRPIQDVVRGAERRVYIRIGRGQAAAGLGRPVTHHTTIGARI